MPTNNSRGLAAYLEATKSPDPLFGDIQKHVLNKAAQQSDRRIDCIHPSEAVRNDWCIRANYYRIVTNVAHNPRQSSFRQENVFQEGHNTHSKYQRWLTEMGKLEGDWECESCGDVWYEFAPANCPSCGSTRFHYEELRLVNDGLHISGRTDGYVPPEQMLIEIKTLGLGSIRYDSPDFLSRYERFMDRKAWVALDNLWRDFRAPLRSARRQGQLYLWLAREAGYDVDKILFIYDFKPTQEAKSFLVYYDRSVIDDVIRKCRDIRDALEIGSAPECNIGSHGSCAACRPYEENA